VVAGRNFIPKALFDPATGAIKVVSATKRVTQGVMVRDKIGYVWDTAGDAYQLVNGGWTPTDIKFLCQADGATKDHRKPNVQYVITPHVRRRPHGIRGDVCRTPAACRRGLAAFRREGYTGRTVTLQAAIEERVEAVMSR
jgi:hypothetical protein